MWRVREYTRGEYVGACMCARTCVCKRVCASAHEYMHVCNTCVHALFVPRARLAQGRSRRATQTQSPSPHYSAPAVLSRPVYSAHTLPVCRRPLYKAQPPTLVVCTTHLLKLGIRIRGVPHQLAHSVEEFGAVDEAVVVTVVDPERDCVRAPHKPERNRTDGRQFRGIDAPLVR